MATQYPWPRGLNIRTLARELRDISANVEGECDVRLAVWSGDGDRAEWAVRYGLADYDQSIPPFGSAGSVPGCGGRQCQPRRFDSYALARYLLDDVREQIAVAEGV